MRVLETHQRLVGVGELHHRVEALESGASAGTALEPVRNSEDIDNA